MNAFAPVPPTTMRRALTDPHLLGGALGGPSWTAWRVLLVAMAGEPLTPEERVVYTKLTSRSCEPLERAEEFWCLSGRRAGKSFAMAVLIIFLAVFIDYRRVLNIGERATVLCLGPSQQQAAIVFRYVAALIELVPLLRPLLRSRTADQLELATGVVIEIRAASFRGLRGVTCAAVVCDEICYWLGEDTSSNPDFEILNALRPSLATTNGPLITISTPYARRGAAFDVWQKEFGEAGDKLIIVAKGESRDFNPTLRQSVIDRAMERDPIAAATEFLAAWRADVENYVSRIAIDGVTVPGRLELPPIIGQTYVAFTDPSGGSIDSFTLGIAHEESEIAVLDLIRERRPPFSPADVVDEFVATLRRYGLSEVVGDRYAGEWTREAFQARGVTYVVSERSKSQIYAEALPLINSKRCELLGLPRLSGQLLGLERRVSRGSSKPNIDHAPGGHDDIANAACGALVLAAGVGGGGSIVEEFKRAWLPGYPSYHEEEQERRRAAALATAEES